MIDVVESRVKVMLSSIIIFTKEMIRIQRFKLIYPPRKVIGLSFYRLIMRISLLWKLSWQRPISPTMHLSYFLSFWIYYFPFYMLILFRITYTSKK